MKFLKEVDDYISKKKQWAEILHTLREIVATTELQETVKWGGPVYTYEGKNIMGLGAFKSYVTIWFFQGALLKDPLNVLINAQEGKTKALRQWRFESLKEIPRKQVKFYIEEAIENQRQGRKIKPSTPKKKPLNIPEELNQAMVQDEKVHSLFESLSLTRKREFSEYISEAKREATRHQRLDKVVRMIKDNVGLYDNYKK